MAHVPAPIPADETSRLAALRQCCVLGTPAEESFDRIVQIAAEIADTPIALVSLVDDMRQWFKARVGLDACETSRDLAFCAHAILSAEPLIVEDTLTDSRFAESPLVIGPPHIRFYAGFPLELSSGERLGTLCVIDVAPRGLDTRTRQLLDALARQAATQLELRRSVFRLELANRERDGLIASLEETKNRLTAADRSKSEFLANMSHEIRTPMTAILGYTDLLLDDGLACDGAIGYLEIMRRNGKLLLDIINDILDISRIEAGRLSLDCTEVELPTLLQDVQALMGGLAKEKGLELVVEIAPDLPTVVRSDPTRLQQVVLNLVSNGVKFTETGSVHVRARRADNASGPGSILIEVRDTGIGIEPEHLEMIFEPFLQADGSNTRRFGGTGLGLGISRRLAELLGGRITVTSTVGRGSQFDLHLELDVPAESAAPPPSEQCWTHAGDPERAATGTEPLKDVRVLLVEDGPDNRCLFTHMLSRAGAEVTEAENGRLALDVFDRALTADEAPDVILMDMQMPEMDGYTATAVLRSRGHRQPIIALTAHSMSGDRDRCLAAGCDDYVNKPVDRAMLIERIRLAAENSTPRQDAA